MSQRNPTTNKIYHASVNACLAPVISVDGKHVITVEGIGNVKKPHPAQERIAVGSGSQCGFCTPGIVMVRYYKKWIDSGTDDMLELICLAAEQSRAHRAGSRGGFRRESMSMHRLSSNSGCCSDIQQSKILRKSCY